MDHGHSDGAEHKFSMFQETLRNRYGEIVFDSWMADLALDQVTEDTVTLSTPSGVKADRLNQQYRPGMQSAWCENVGQIKRMVIIARPRLRASAALAEKKSATFGYTSFGNDHGTVVGGPSSQGRRDTERAAQEFSAKPSFLRPKRKDEAQTADRRVHSLQSLASPVDPRMTFEAFAIGPSNEVAYAAARRVFIDAPARDIIYIYGPSGCGKTHLLQAIAQEWQKRFPGSAASYFTYSNMRDGCSSAAMSNGLFTLHEELRARDLLLIDDLHLLNTSVRTQEEILNLANAFPSSGRQLVIAGELAPSRLPETGINQRLADRLAGGLPAPMEQGGEALRLEVLKKRRAADAAQCSVTDDAIAFIARHFPQSMREAIGAFNQMMLVYGGKPQTIGAVEAQLALKSLMVDRPRAATLEECLDAAAAAFGLRVADLKGRAQPQAIVRGRHAFVMVGRENLKESFPRLGKALNRDHTTAMSSYERAQALFERDQRFRTAVAAIRSAIGV